jgi:hypothetical protein
LVAQRRGHFWKVGDAISVFLQMGCELRQLPGEIETPDGERMTVRFLFNAQTGGFVELIDLSDDDSVSLEEIEYWERRLSMDIPKGNNTH